MDWTRGLAAVVMLQGHTFNSFTRIDLREKDAYMLSQFAGGLPPAIFLFLTGMTFAFLMNSQDKADTTGWQKIWAALKRSRYLFLLAFLFRVQLFTFGYPNSPAGDLWKVDILNCMGFAMLVFAPMALFSTLERARLCLVLGLFVAGLAPVMSQFNSNSIPGIARCYLMPSFDYFGFFPWAAYLAFGMTAGSIVRLLKHEDLSQLMFWAMTLGVGLMVVCQYASGLNYSIYGQSNFWLNSPALTFTRVGIILVVLAVAYIWVNVAGEPSRWSLFRQLGTTSLLVYWVHVELVYGRWFGFWKQNLSVSGVLLYTVCLIALMTLLSIAQTRWKYVRGILRRPMAEPERISGD